MLRFVTECVDCDVSLRSTDEMNWEHFEMAPGVAGWLLEGPYDTTFTRTAPADHDPAAEPTKIRELKQ